MKLIKSCFGLRFSRARLRTRHVFGLINIDKSYQIGSIILYVVIAPLRAAPSDISIYAFSDYSYALFDSDSQ